MKKSDYPVRRMRLPKALKDQQNGKLDPTLLRKTRAGGQLWTGATKAFNAMYLDASIVGVDLSLTGSGYRTYDRQLQIFNARYSDKPTKRVPPVTRKFEGKTYWLRVGMSPSATPGTSPHGWALAVDLNVSDPKTFRWLCNNAPRYGFYLQGKPTKLNGKPNPEYEPWHWQFCLADRTPPALRGVE